MASDVKVKTKTGQIREHLVVEADVISKLKLDDSGGAVMTEVTRLGVDGVNHLKFVMQVPTQETDSTIPG